MKKTLHSLWLVVTYFVVVLIVSSSQVNSKQNNASLPTQFPENLPPLATKTFFHTITVEAATANLNLNRVVKNTRTFPYSAVSQVFTTYSKHTLKGTGSIIYDKYVITAAHNIYNKELKEMPKKIQIIPGAYSDGKKTIAPFGQYTVIKKSIPKEWLNNFNPKYDIAILELNQAVGRKTGNLNLSTQLTKNITLPSFPGEYYINNKHPRMVSTSGSYSSASAKFLYYNLYTANGSSGAPVFDTNKKIIGIHTTGASKSNAALRITPTLMTFINQATKKTVPKNTVRSKTTINKQVSVKKNNETRWTNLNFTTKKGTTTGLIGSVYKTTQLVTMSNGERYYSLYDKNNTFQGYVKSSAVVEVKAVSFNKKVSIKNGATTRWNNFFFSSKRGTTKGLVGKNYQAKLIYTLGNGQKYYSIYDNKNNWHGYVNVSAFK